jgi:hypothetical protein
VIHAPGLSSPSLPCAQTLRGCDFAVVCFALLFACPAFASLGGDVSSVVADQAHVRGTLRTTQAQNYTVQEIHSANSTVLREYVSTSGKVFAVTWHGPWIPDLRQLLAEYFDQFAQAQHQQATARPGQRVMVIRQPGLVVQSSGHPRAFAGRAYIPELLPAGVTPDQIQ